MSRSEYPDSEALEQYKEQQRLEQQIAQLEAGIRQRLTKDAYMRYANIRAANPDLATRVLVALAQHIEKNNIQQIDDEQFKSMLRHLTQKKDIRIRRR